MKYNEYNVMNLATRIYLVFVIVAVEGKFKMIAFIYLYYDYGVQGI